MLKYLVKNIFLQQNMLLLKGDHELNSFFKTAQVKPYGGRVLRVGQTGDGGYIIPNCLEGIKGVFSPGVGDICDFEMDMTNRFDIPIYACDFSVNNMPNDHKNFHFKKKFLGFQNNDTHMTLQSWAAQYMIEKGDYILQMDIEGGEYDVLMHTPMELLQRFRIMVIEFHNLELLFNKLSRKMIHFVFDKITQDFTIIHAHPNNNDVMFKHKDYAIPSVMEFTLVRNDYYQSGTPLTFPNSLDSRNNPDKPELILPPCWYKN